MPEKVQGAVSPLSLRKAPFSASVQQRGALAYLGVWPGKVGVSARVPSGNSPTQRLRGSLKGLLAEVQVQLREQALVVMYLKITVGTFAILSAEGTRGGNSFIETLFQFKI